MMRVVLDFFFSPKTRARRYWKVLLPSFELIPLSEAEARGIMRRVYSNERIMSQKWREEWEIYDPKIKLIHVKESKEGRCMAIYNPEELAVGQEVIIWS